MRTSWRVLRSGLGVLTVLVLLLSVRSAQAGGNGCGLIGEPCCPIDVCTEGTCLGCLGETAGGGAGEGCVPTCSCGAPGLGCCPGNVCQPGFVCVQQEDNCEALQNQVDGLGSGAVCEVSGNGSGATVKDDCVPCGGSAELCCAGDVCDEGFVCEPPIDMMYEGIGGGAGIPERQCRPCGDSGQPCCDSQCNTGFNCEPFVPCDDTADHGAGAAVNFPDQCVPCGTLDLPCCNAGSACLSETLLCGGELCEECGELGIQCCAGNTCRGAGACVDGTCEPGAAAPAMGWGMRLALIGILIGLGSIGLRARSKDVVG